MDTILLTGKTSLFSAEDLRMAGESCRVLVTGRKFPISGKDLPENVLHLPVRYMDSDFQKAFELGEVRAVWHVSTSADGGKTVDERRQLRAILQLCAAHGVPRLIILTESTDPTDHQELIDEWSEHGEHRAPMEGMSPVEIMTVNLPLLVGTGTAKGRLRRIFRSIEERRHIRLQGYADTALSVLSMQDLTNLLLRITTETWCRSGVYAADANRTQLAQLRETLLSIRPDGLIEYTEGRDISGKESRGIFSRGFLRVNVPATDIGACDGQLCDLYRLKPSPDWRGQIGAQYAALQEDSLREASGFAGMREFLRQFGKLIGVVLDVAVMFFLAEYLSRITSESVYFKIVDVRLLFVILMGMMHGLMTGLAAAILECIMLVLRYQEVGISGLLLFYNVENWIPFVYYLTAGAICGYSHRKKQQEMRSVCAENDLIRNKYLFLNEAYRASVTDRRELRAQILSEEESYARLYRAVRQMSQRTPESVCVEAVKVFRDLLENPTVSIYELDAAGRRADLLSCCRENALRPAILTQDCREMMEVTGRGETWKNTSLYEDLPMYAAQVHCSRRLQNVDRPGGHGFPLPNAAQPGTGRTLPNASQPGTGRTLPDAAQPGTGRTLPNASQPGTGRTKPNAAQPGTGRTKPNAAQPGTGRAMPNAMQAFREERGSSTLLVTVELAGQDQMNLWYMNHFSILCGLFRDALEYACLREKSMD